MKRTRQRHSKPDAPFMPACLSNHFAFSPLSFLQSFHRIGTINESLSILRDQRGSTKHLFSKIPRTPRYTLSPYTTLFPSHFSIAISSIIFYKQSSKAKSFKFKRLNEAYKAA